jgi:ABC-type dipeptide/oligopeptide/nickel transport system permease component
MRSWIRSQRWWLGRLGVLPVHLLVFAIITFFLVRLMPADPARAMLGQNFTPEAYQKLKHQLGLDGSVVHQLWTYLGQLAHGNLGTSLFTQRSVVSELSTRLPSTVEIAILGLSTSVVLALIGSYVAVMHPRTVAGKVIRAYAAAAGAIPEYVLAVAGIFILYSMLHLAPAPMGRLSAAIATPAEVTHFPLLDALLAGRPDAFTDELEHLAMPVFVLAVSEAAVLVKLLVGGLEEAIAAAPTRFRIATGASRKMVLASIYRRAAPSAITMCGILFGYLLGGAVILENLFGFNGVGAYAVNAVSSGDFVALQGFLLVVAFLSMLVFLITDLVNMTIDPRRRPGTAGES